MLQINYIRDNKDEVIKRLEKKHFKDAAAVVGKVLEFDNQRRAAQKEADDSKAEANAIAKQIGELMRTGKKDEAEKLKTRTAELKSNEKQLDEKQKTIE